MATFAPTPLVENSNVIVQVPQGFNVQMAWLLAQCSNLTYTQYDLGPGQLPDFSSLQMGSSNNTITTSNPVAFNVSEAAGSGSIPGDVGDYYPAAAGFAVTITQSNPAPGTPATFIVIALRGTRTWTEWMDDVEAVPIGFDGTFNGAITYGAVHVGILGYYTIGTNGANYGNNGWMTRNNRPTGSLAAQIASYVGALSSPQNIYVTGHSLGGALASICAYDLALNFSQSYSSLTMYNFASPRVAMGGDLKNYTAVGVSVSTFLQNYQKNVPNSYRIVHASDIIPILPSTDLVLGPIELTAAHVTDGWSIGMVYNPGLSANVVNFCAQSGDIGTNHSCSLTYLPYAQWLASASGNAAAA